MGGSSPGRCNTYNSQNGSPVRGGYATGPTVDYRCRLPIPVAEAHEYHRARTCHNERIQRWLDQLRACSGTLPETSDHNNEDPAATTPVKQPWRPHNLPLAAVDGPSGKQHDGGIVQSPENDLLLSISPSSRGQKSFFTLSPSSGFSEPPSPKKKRRRTSSQTPPTHTFEKQPRRKTRHDRYDTNKSQVRPSTGKKRQTSRPKKRLKTAKAKLRSGREVMDNFVSSAVAKARVTTKPNLKTGLFLNGRSSSSKKPVADLSFNDMELPGVDDNKGTKKDISKSRLRSQRRMERELQQESDFFADHHGLLARSSSHMAPDCPESADRNETERHKTANTSPQDSDKRKLGHQSDEFSPWKAVQGPKNPSRHGSNKPSKRPPSRNHAGGDEGARERGSLEDLNDDYFLRALRDTGVFDFPGLSRETVPALPPARDPQNTARSRSRFEALSETAYRDKGVMVSPDFSTSRPRQPLHPPTAHDGDETSQKVPCHGDLEHYGVHEMPSSDLIHVGTKNGMSQHRCPSPQCTARADGLGFDVRHGPNEAYGQPSPYNSQAPPSQAPFSRVNQHVEASERGHFVGTAKRAAPGAQARDHDGYPTGYAEGGKPYLMSTLDNLTANSLDYSDPEYQPLGSAWGSAASIHYPNLVPCRISRPSNYAGRSDSHLGFRHSRVRPPETFEEDANETTLQFIERAEAEAFGSSENPLLVEANDDYYSGEGDGAYNGTGDGPLPSLRHYRPGGDQYDASADMDALPSKLGGDVWQSPWGALDHTTSEDFQRQGQAREEALSPDLDMAAFWRPNFL